MKKLTRVQKKRIKKRAILVVLALIIVYIISLKILSNISFFNIKKINIEGNIQVSKDDLIKNTQLKVGKNIFSYNMAKEKKKILNNPYVEDVSVKRKLPNIINIAIKEKPAVYQIRNVNNLAIIDKKGIILDVTSKPKEGLSLINGVELNGKIDSSNIEDNFFDMIKNEKIRELFRNDINVNGIIGVRELNFQKNKLEILNNDGSIVEFGYISNSGYKLKLLKEIYNQIKKNDLKVERIIMDGVKNPIIVEKKEVE